MEQSGWLDFLRRAQGITLECLARRHGTQRSNISVFVTSRGEKKNISFDRVKSILFNLGVLIDGILLPGVHCWQIDKGMSTNLQNLLLINKYEKLFFFQLVEDVCNNVVFMVAQVSKETFIFAIFGSGVIKVFKESFIRNAPNNGIKNIVLSREEWVALHDMWNNHKALLLQGDLLHKLKKMLDA